MKWFYNLKISKKLIYSFLFVSLIAVVMSTMSIIRFTDLADQDTLMYKDCVISIQNLSMALARFEKANAITRDEVMAADMSIAAGKTRERQELSKEIGAYLTKYEPSVSTAEEKQLYGEFLVYRKQFKDAAGKFDQLISSGQTEQAKLLLNGELSGIREGYRVSLQKLIDQNIESARQISESNASNSRTAILSLIIFSIIGVAVSIGLGIFVSVTIKNPITKVLLMAQEIQKGHVKARANVEGEDEIGVMAKALDHVASQLEALAGGMHSISKGDLSIQLPVYDKDDALAPAMNTITDTLKELVNEVNTLATEAVNGNIENRGNTEKYEGGYRLIVSGFNNTLDTIVKNVRDYEKVIEKVGHGDLTARMIGDYRGNFKNLQNNANGLAGSLGNLISDVSEAIAATASAANEISSSSEQMAAGAHEQSQQATEVAGAVEEMTKTILESSQYAAKASENSRLASDSAKEGAKKVEDTKKGMLKIVESTKSTSEKITSLARKTDQIGEIAQVIDDIADQTNLLALNAAIEAARAGEQGRGFAVVADEVRKLAERTTKATKEIADTIKQIQLEAKDADSSMNEAGKAVEEGMQLTEAVALSLTQILDVNQKVSDIVTQVAAASEEQSSAAEQISKNIEGISSVTQQSAAGTEQIARAAEDLNRLTVNLQDLVSRFKLSETESGSSMGSLAVRSNRKLLRH